MDELQQRLIDLEIRFTHQARQLEELNDEVLECHRRIARLEEENRRTRETLRSMAPATPLSPDE